MDKYRIEKQLFCLFALTITVALSQSIFASNNMIEVESARMEAMEALSNLKKGSTYKTEESLHDILIKLNKMKGEADISNTHKEARKAIDSLKNGDNGMTKKSLENIIIQLDNINDDSGVDKQEGGIHPSHPGPIHPLIPK